MTPPALTPAARTTRRKAPTGGNASGRAGTPPRPATKSRSHRSQLRQGTAPRTARRVSGPLTGLTRERAAPTRRPPSAPRRRATRPAAAPAGLPLAARAAAYVRALPDHSLLDRIIRGRVWIPLLGVVLAGIVAMQVEVLKLGASIGRSIQRSSVLASQNQQLRAGVAALADEQRIERLAGGMGMVMPPPTAVGFLPAQRGDVAAVISNIHAPDPAGFLSMAASNGTVVTTASLAAANGAASSSATTTGGPVPALATTTSSQASTSTGG
jgi:hypothetical protein